MDYQKNLGARADSSLEIRQQGNYRLNNLHLQNYTDSEIEIEAGEIIGRIFVGNNDNIVINPCNCGRVEMNHILDSVISSEINADNFSIISSISNMLETQQLVHKNKSSRFMNKAQKLIKIKSLVLKIKDRGSNKIEMDKLIKLQ